MSFNIHAHANELLALLQANGEHWTVRRDELLGRMKRLESALFSGPDGIQFRLTYREWSTSAPIAATFSLRDTGYGDLRCHSPSRVADATVRMTPQESTATTVRRLRRSVGKFRKHIAAAVENRDRADALEAAVNERADAFTAHFPATCTRHNRIRTMSTPGLHVGVDIASVDIEAQIPMTQVVLSIYRDGFDENAVAVALGKFLTELTALRRDPR